MQPEALDIPKESSLPQTRRMVRVPYRSFGANKPRAPIGRDEAKTDGPGTGAVPGNEAFSAWAKERNRRLVRMAAGRPIQPPTLPPLSKLATSQVNKRSSANDLLKKTRRAVSDAPDAAENGIGLAVERRGTRVPIVYAGDLPPPERNVAQHPWVRSPSLPSLNRRSYPSLVVLMILIWGVVLGAGIYKALKPPSGFSLANDRW